MARKDFGAKPYTYPQPVFILATYNEDGTANAMNAAWGGISEGNEISFCISAGHKTTKNFQRTGAFTVSMADAKHVAACDYVGIESANNVAGKLDKAGFTVTKSANVDAPIINELAVCAECKVKSYDPEFALFLICLNLQVPCRLMQHLLVPFHLPHIDIYLCV